MYAIYCTAKTGIYKKYNAVNRTAYNLPIYIGKAVPQGWRQGRVANASDDISYELHNRLKEHSRSINVGHGLTIDDFRCRFMILEGRESDLIGTVEAALIRAYLPLWNTVIDGFGNHDPGSGRYKQAKSDWDVCHPGREWAEKCKGNHAPLAALQTAIKGYWATLEIENG